MKIINLTPHTVNFYKSTGETATDGLQLTLSIPSSGMLRVAEHKELIGHIGDIPVVSKRFGKVDAPKPQENTIYVVSQITAQALKEQGRTEDIYIIDNAVRQDEQTGELATGPQARGRIVGCTGLAQI